MVGYIGQVVYAARVLTFLGKDVKKPTYWVGAVFPDIHRLGSVTRHFTHVHETGLKTLRGKNDFLTGLRTHSWIERTREAFFIAQHGEEILPWHPLTPLALALLEDELLYSHFDDWNLIHRLLNKVHEEELAYILSEDDIRNWHTILQKYIKKEPTNATRKQLLMALAITPAMADEANELVRRLREDQKSVALLKKFWHHLDHLLL